jgi:hypothetical protein
MATAGVTRPRVLKSLRTAVLERVPDAISLSPMPDETTVTSQKTMYGRDERPPFFELSFILVELIYFKIGVCLHREKEV